MLLLQQQQQQQNTYTHLHYIVKVFNWSTEEEGRSSQPQK